MAQTGWPSGRVLQLPPLPPLCPDHPLSIPWLPLGSRGSSVGVSSPGSLPSWGFCAASCGQGLRALQGSSPLTTALPPAKLKYFPGVSYETVSGDVWEEHVPCTWASPGCHHLIPQSTEQQLLGLGNCCSPSSTTSRVPWKKIACYLPAEVPHPHRGQSKG